MITNSSLPSERLAFAHLAARRFEEAIEWADRALHEQPRFIVAIRAKIVANARDRFQIAEWRAFAAPLFAPEFLELYLTGMRLAGLPEG